ncbi:tetratricopeptide repeat protein [Geobacter pelophilus]|uniref:Tetratricopeptide repeat protein n=1 Tax=Geoanaerobacter pelophilus TaxID=60036 RepID=A0AAW4L6B5_9BACT|nr:tetratricopeptide repeat protein [Geoanaerobacter pelophilus]MBT0666541.1 tetratricopeptide repeat protein [Geoanaerobacter pelophilus]
MAKWRLSTPMVATLAALCCFLVYFRALGCGYVWFDDPDYVINNQAIRSLDWQFLHWAFTNSQVSLWMPLTWVSLAIDYHFWGLNPFGYHLTNILLHGGNVFLVVLLADRLYQPVTGEPETSMSHGSLFRGGMLLAAALLFGIHPLRVESVAWITERKDVLNGFFALCSMLCYLAYVRGKRADRPGCQLWWFYGASLLWFICSLMVKPVSLALPFMLLVLDWYPLARVRSGEIKRLLLEKVPFMVFSVAMVVISLLAATMQGSFTSVRSLPFAMRCLVAGNGLFEYCRLMLFPVGIVPFYVLNMAALTMFIVKTVIIVLFTGVMVFSWRKRPWLTAGWLLFVLPLLPVLGFFQNGEQAFAARFTYLGSIIPTLFVPLLATERGTGTRKTVLLVATCLVLCWYGAETRRLIPVWDNSGTFWSRVIDLEPLGRAYQERGLYNFDNGNAAAAADDLAAAMEIARANGVLGFNLVAHRGKVLLALKRYDEAIVDFTEAIAMYPDPRYCYQRGLALQSLGKFAEADKDFQRAAGDTRPIKWIEPPP